LTHPGAHKRKIPIWLATLIVIIMIILFSMLINNAREKEIVEQFSLQQIVIARGMATGFEELFSDVGKRMTVNSGRRGLEQSGLTRDEVRTIYEDLAAKVHFIAGGDETLSRLSIYPAMYRKDFLSKQSQMQDLIQKAKLSGKPCVSDLIKFDGDETAQTGDKMSDNFIILAVPRFDANHDLINMGFAALSLQRLVDRYIKPAVEKFSYSVWIMDEQGAVLCHPNPEMIREDAARLEAKNTSGSLSLKEKMLKGGDGMGEYLLYKENRHLEKHIVAFAPINLDSRKWTIAVGLPYQETSLHLKKTFVILMLEAFVLIGTVIAGSAIIFYSSRKRLLLEGELRRFKERDTWQEKLAKEKKTIEGILEGSPIPTFVIDRNHKIMFWNKACQDLTGFRSEDMIGTENQNAPFYSEKRPVIADLIVDGDIDGLEKYYCGKRVQPSAVVKGAYEATDVYDKLGGKLRHLYFLAAPIYDDSGKIIAAVETLQDVTREREMERDLKDYAESLKAELNENIKLRQDIEELYHYLQSILDSSPDRIYALSSDGVITYMSRALSLGDGLLSKPTEDRHFTEFASPENKEIMLQKWAEVKQGIYKPYELETKARDGSRRILMLTTRPIEGTDRFILINRDITEFKNLEKKFYESQKLAALGQLSAGIAHEVRNPLSSIKMNLHILEKNLHPEGNDQKRFKIAEREVEHLEKLINDILIYARPLELKAKSGDINTFLGNSVMMAEKQILEKKINVEYHFQPDIPSVTFDQAMLKQAFLNFYLNAIDAMEEGGTLSIETRSTAKDGKSFVVIEIGDNGSGIEKDNIPHLFNPFFTTKKNGTGLGLTQAKKIIDLHQGTIEMISTKGEGTKAVVTLPA
jgi:PAS domain S-box-containing protein